MRHCLRAGVVGPVVALIVNSATGCASGTRTQHCAASSPSSAVAEQLPWCVWGYVSSQTGRGLAGVEVVAHCGSGTLFETGRTVSDADGRYQLHFGPGVLMMDDSAALQAATISSRKAGQCEANLHRQGDLLMARREPTPDESGVWGLHGAIVLPNRPVRVDFRMVPSAELAGWVVDGRGRPIVNAKVWLSGDALPPSSSVVASAETDGVGVFSMSDVPPRAWWFICDAGERREVRSDPFDFNRPGKYSIELILDPAAAQPLKRRIAARP